MRYHTRLGASLLIAGVAQLALAGQGVEETPAKGPTVTATVERTIAEVGRTRVIAWTLAEPATEPLALVATSSQPATLEVVASPSITAGAEAAYVRVIGRQPGRAKLMLGGARMTVEVVEPRLAGEDHRYAPRVIGPAPGSVAWGTITAGVEMRMAPGSPDSTVVVAVNGVRTAPVEDTNDDHAPFRYLAYEIDCEALVPGRTTLQAIEVRTNGTEQVGPMTAFTVVHPDLLDVIDGEAESDYSDSLPENVANAPAQLGRDRFASGGAYYASASSFPPLYFPFDVEEAGHYQLVLRMGGTRAQGVLPTIAVMLDNLQNIATNGRSLQRGWHRAPIGRPFHVEAGSHFIAPFFANDFFVANRADRNLFIDYIELLRVDAPAAATMIDDPLGQAGVPVRIVQTRTLDGLTIPGIFEIEGRVSWRSAKTTPAPHVTLLVNDEPIAAQRSGAPRFWVDPAALRPGANRIQLFAEHDDGAARTPVQVIHRPTGPAAEELPRRTHVRFAIHEPAWQDLEGRLDAQHNPSERRSLVFARNGEAVLNLPSELSGSFKVFLELHGEHFDGPPIAHVSLRAGGTTTRVGSIDAKGWWSTQQAGDVSLPAGPKQLTVAFDNDHYVESQGDRNLRVQALILAENHLGDDRSPPHAAITWPPDEHVAWRADAVVVDASDNTGLLRAELIIDGRATGLRQPLVGHVGPIVLPLILRDLDPGRHAITVQVTDSRQNSIRTEPVTVIVAGAAPEVPGRYARSIHLLNRIGWGPDARQLASILTLGEEAWLASQLEPGVLGAGDLAALQIGLVDFAGRNNYEVPRRVLSHLMTTPHPARLRLALWVENHFSTYIQKTQGVRKWDEHVEFMRLGAAPFQDLLLASAESPAMLVYLDQEGSYGDQVNENYAREIMELHTLGVHGGYTQADVTSLSNLLTGWTSAMQGDGITASQEAQAWSFRYDPRLSDGSAMTVLGHAFPETPPGKRFERAAHVIEILAAHPSTARFVARKFAMHFVDDPPPDEFVDDLAMVFAETGGDLRAMLFALAGHPAFWATIDAPRIASPLDYAIRLCRVASHRQPWQVGDFLQRSGMGLFERPTPDGYPEDNGAFGDSNAMLQRWRLAGSMPGPLTSLVPPPWRFVETGSEDEWRQQVVDVLALRLTGMPLTEASNTAALDLLEETPGTREQRLRVLAPVIAGFPEANLK
ncbi:MAG: DUF1800 family protein [Planctomycetota bacterium]|jgi:hypothetical protein